MSVVTVYSMPDCHLCAEAMTVLRGLQAQVPFELRELDISDDDALLRAYFERIPVVEVDGEVVSELLLDRSALMARLDTLVR